MADGVSLGLGVVSAVIQTYSAVTSAYDVYLSVKEFPSTYRELRTAFMVERYRLEQWGDQMLSDVQQERIEKDRNVALWKLFQNVFDSMWKAFQESDKTLEDYGSLTGIPKGNDMSGQLLAGYKSELHTFARLIMFRQRTLGKHENIPKASAQAFSHWSCKKCQVCASR